MKKLLWGLFVVVILAGCAPAGASLQSSRGGNQKVLSSKAAATQPAAPTSTPAGVLVTQASGLVGIWQLQIPGHGTNYLLIRPDNTYSISPNKDGSHGQSGTYSFVNGTFDMQNDICAQDSTYTVRRQSLDTLPDALIFNAVNAPCPTLTGFLTQPAPTWVGPLQ